MLCYCICRLKPFYFTEPPRVVVFSFFFFALKRFCWCRFCEIDCSPVYLGSITPPPCSPLHHHLLLFLLKHLPRNIQHKWGSSNCADLCVCVCVSVASEPTQVPYKAVRWKHQDVKKKKSRKEAKVSSFKSGAGATSPEDHWLQTVGRGFVNQLVQMVKLWALLEDEGEAISSLGGGVSVPWWPQPHSHNIQV